MSIAVLETVSMWSSIQLPQINKEELAAIQKQQEPYIDPWLKRNSPNNLSPKSLDICTESLCSETGSNDFFDSDFFSSSSSSSSTTQHSESRFRLKARKAIAVSAPRRSIPPPLSSLSRPNGRSSMQMRAHRIEGRLIVQAVSVPEHNYLHAERRNGRLLLSFKNTVAPSVEGPSVTENEIIPTHNKEKKEKVERVRVQVDLTPAARVHSSGREEIQWVSSNAITTATSVDEEGCFIPDEKAVFTSKRKNKEELLHDMRRCSELRMPLFIWEPGCIATSF